MNRWRDIVIPPQTPLLDAIKILDRSATQILLITDSENRLLGTVTDGDVRRAILRGNDLSIDIAQVMNSKPFTIRHDLPFDRPRLLAIMVERKLRHVPVVDDSGHLLRLEFEDDLLRTQELPNPVVLMVGGLGERLRPLTEECPKPLLSVGGRPLLETIILQLASHGFRHFHLAVNYKAEMFESHFGDGSRLGVNISYVREETKLGTAGALSLLPGNLKDPILVMNGDVLTDINYHALLNFHAEHRATATMCVREYDIEVPYGVVDIDKNSNVIGIIEKPKHRFFINAGIYLLNGDTVSTIEKSKFLDMPSFIERIKGSGGNVSAFPIREYWLDIGRMDDFMRANTEFPLIFGNKV